MNKPDGAVGRDDVIVLRLKKATSTQVDDLSDLRNPLATFIKRHKLASRRAIQSVVAQQLLDWESEARGDPFAPPFSLTTFWLLDTRHADQPLKALVAGLRKLASVAEAYQQPRYQPAIATPVDDPMYTAGDQGYLEPATTGIDAEWAWRLVPSRDGAGANFIDVELGWQDGHEDVPPLPPLGGVTMPQNPQGSSLAFHGLAVLGIVNARTHNAIGIAGAAPGASLPLIASALHADGTVNVAEALVAVRAVATRGDVVLIEVQTSSQWPVESSSLDKAAIMLTVSAGLVVVEAAGNAGVDLATVIDTPAVDSGAILVAAGHSAAPHAWHPNSNWGARADAYAWGENVCTTGGIGTSPPPAPPQTAPNRYTMDFGGTSAASAIVAGAALLVQGAYKASTLGARTPSQMRDLFHTTGTPGGGGHPIGRMPDLRQLLPDVYIRDNLTDDGIAPTAGLLSISPDVIVTTATVANPQATYGAGSANENVDTLGEQVEFGQTNYVYVRMKNRGTGIAAGCRATVYWSDPATLVTPSVWTLIGTTAPVDVGPSLTVTDALAWNGVPATGHYCFVAVIDHPLDPAPALPTGGWTEFVDFIRGNNNVTWRNFNVVDLVANAPEPAPFMIRGAPDSKRTFDLEILQEPAGKMQIDFAVPLDLSRRLAPAAIANPVIDKERQVAVYRLPRKRSVTFPKVVLPARAAFPCEFVIRGVAPDQGPFPTVAIRQLFKSVEVGRVTWAFRAKG